MLFYKDKEIKQIRLLLARIVFGLFLLSNAITYFYKRNFWTFTFFILSLLFFIIIIPFFQPLPPASDLSSSVIVKIPSGINLSQVSDSLYEKGLIGNKKLFQLLGIISGKDEKIRSGLYRIPRKFTSWQILNYLSEGKNVVLKVTIPEGITSDKIAGILQKTIEIDSSKFMSLIKDSNFSKSLGIETRSLEGYLLPETYYFDWEMSEIEILKFLVNKTLALFESDSVRERLFQLDMSVNEILTLASIIEGEVQLDSERTIISSVYHNRLARGWRLQADPTIQYIIRDGPRRLTYKDLDIDSPYNTYKHSGLPPGPINNPGKRSIFAALYPADTPYLYFVAIGDGSHRFSRTSQEHAFWKRKLDQLRRKVFLEKRKEKNAGRTQ